MSWNAPFVEYEEPTPIVPLRRLIGAGGVAGYLLLGIDVLKVASIRGRDLSDYNVVDGSALMQIAYVGLCLLYSVHHFSRSRPPGAIYLLKATPVSLLLAYTVLSAASSLWSPSLSLTLYRSMECLSFLLLIAIVCDNLSRCCSRQDVIEWIVLWSMWFLAWDLLRAIRLMGLAVFASEHAFRGGNFGLSMVFFLTLFLSKRRLFVMVNLVFSILSLANTTYFGIFFGLLPSLKTGGRKLQIVMFFATGLMVLSFLWMGQDVLQNTLFYGKEGVGIEHTTGRDRIWLYALEYGMDRFFYGYGFVAGETEALSVTGLPAITTHNVFLSAFLSVGVVGPVLFGVFFIWLARLSLGSDVPQRWRAAFLGTTIMMFLTSFASPGLGARVYGSWIPAVLTAMVLCTVARWESVVLLNEMADEDYRQYAGALTRQELPG